MTYSSHDTYSKIRSGDWEVMFKQRQVHCAVNKTVWDKDKNQFNCPSSINVYHCIQDERNRTGELCIQPVWVQKGMCLIQWPIYSTKGLRRTSSETKLSREYLSHDVKVKCIVLPKFVLETFFFPQKTTFFCESIKIWRPLSFRVLTCRVCPIDVLHFKCISLLN